MHCLHFNDLQLAPLHCSDFFASENFSVARALQGAGLGNQSLSLLRQDLCRIGVQCEDACTAVFIHSDLCVQDCDSGRESQVFKVGSAAPPPPPLSGSRPPPPKAAAPPPAASQPPSAKATPPPPAASKPPQPTKAVPPPVASQPLPTKAESKPKATDSKTKPEPPIEATKEAKPAEAKPVEAKPAEAKPVEAKPAEAKPEIQEERQETSEALLH